MLLNDLAHVTFTIVSWRGWEKGQQENIARMFDARRQLHEQTVKHIYIEHVTDLVVVFVAPKWPGC